MFVVETFNSRYTVQDGRVTREVLNGYDPSGFVAERNLFRPGNPPVVGKPWYFKVCIDGRWEPVRTSVVGRTTF